jgi:DNA-binding transcriptional ArsR family regulator
MIEQYTGAGPRDNVMNMTMAAQPQTAIRPGHPAGTSPDCLPSSAQAVFSVLGDGKPRTLNEIIGMVSFSPRTIRNALHRLRQNGLIVAKFNFRDARKPLYQVKTA